MTVLCRATFLLTKVGKVKKKEKKASLHIYGASKTETELHVDKKVGYIEKNATQHDVGKLFLW